MLEVKSNGHIGMYDEAVAPEAVDRIVSPVNWPKRTITCGR
jgi:hypothetical protein